MTEFNKVVNGEIIPCTADEIDQLTSEWAANDATTASTLYRGQRTAKYPSISDQIDILYKTFVHMQANGTDVGPIGEAWITEIAGIKAQYPKPV